MIAAAAEMDAPAEVLWQLLASTARWPEWGPAVRAVEPPAAIVAPGLRGRVRTALGVWLPFVVTSVDPGRSWRWRVAGVDATGHRVEPLGPRRCCVQFDVPWWAAPYVFVCKVALHRLARIAELPRSPR